MQCCVYVLIAHLLIVPNVIETSKIPLMIFPPFLKANSTNMLSLTSLSKRTEKGNIEILNSEKKKLLKFGVKLDPGVTKESKFLINGNDEVLTFIYSVNDKEKYVKNLTVLPDLRAVHISTDKQTYRTSETINIKILPLKHSGRIYTDALQLMIINPKGFKIYHSIINVDLDESPIITANFPLPSQLFFGTWKIRVKPINRNSEYFEREFNVRNYELPPFKVNAFFEESSNISNMIVSVRANYFHGLPIDGSFFIYCDNNDGSYDPSNKYQLIRGQIENGQWTNSINMTKCLTASNKLKDSLNVVVRDTGTGNRVETKLDWKKTSFRVQLARPYFSRKTSTLSIMINDDKKQELEVTLYCLTKEDMDERKKIRRKGKFGGIIESIELPVEWREKCSVLQVNVTRIINDALYEPSLLYVPNLSATTMGAFVIEIDEPKAEYAVSDVVDVHVNNTDNDIRFMVICNSQTVIRLDNINKNQEQKSMKFEITEKMKGACIIVGFMMSSDKKVYADMLMFTVRRDCKEKLIVSKVGNDGKLNDVTKESNLIEPGDSLELDFYANPKDIVFYRAIDDRHNYILNNEEYAMGEYVDLSIFGDMHSELPARANVVNLVDVEQLKRVIANECKKAGSEIRFKCKNQVKTSNSVLLEYCFKYLYKECTSWPTVQMATSKSGVVSAKKEDVTDVLQIRELNDPGQRKPAVRTRENFQEVWLFDATPVKSDGTLTIRSNIPDSNGLWSISSAFLSNGNFDMCPLENIYIESKKNIFLEVDMPRNVYVNETVIVRITVTSLKLRRLKRYSICLTGLSRKVCADEGLNGYRGKPAYTNVALDPLNRVQTKTFSMIFLQSGTTNITVKLREESARLNNNYCDSGTILDIVKLNLNIKKRADSITFSEKTVLDSNNKVLKEVSKSNDHSKPIEFETSGNRKGLTIANINIFDTEKIYHFKVELSRFQTNDDDIGAISVHSRFPMRHNSFLTDVIRQFSTQLYRYKMVSKKSQWMHRVTLSQILSEMIMFSDCESNDEPCGYSQFPRPMGPSDRDLFLTSIVTSLLCEANVGYEYVVGPLKTIIDAIDTNTFENVILESVFDMSNNEDRKYFLFSVMYQVSRDCIHYKQEFDDSIRYDMFNKLHQKFYSVDETTVEDDRTLAAMAFMATDGIQKLMKLTMLSHVNVNAEPYWIGGKYVMNTVHFNNYSDTLLTKLSGDLTVNSLGLLAFLSEEKPSSIDFEILVDWINKHKRDDGSFLSAIDTYFASRALYQYKTKTPKQSESNSKVIVSCKGCRDHMMNGSDTQSVFYLPAHVKTVYFDTIGRGKVIATISIIAEKSQRQRRGLSQDDYYPILFNVEQNIVEKIFLEQTVCLRVLNPVIKTVELTHGLFTGFKSSQEKILILDNSTEVNLLNPVSSSYAMHFVLTNIPNEKPICYKLIQSPPMYNNEPAFLAPVAIEARHSYAGTVGVILISHPDVYLINDGESSSSSITDRTAVETVCFDGDACACAETTCEVTCGSCRIDNQKEIREYLSQPMNFGVSIRVVNVHTKMVERAEYQVIEGKVLLKKDSSGLIQVDEVINILRRQCKSKCVLVEPDRAYLVLSSHEGLVVDANGRKNYVLRESDRFEAMTAECQELNSAISLQYD